eukprot:CAMPEP_0171087122 /NCGR_PEP_ID=MMETSP0766_2-20121228/19962_1 /TAXON_ID=439317 /ORGANISM="Gambierdiscus australes, Strain CAWD 149" /LENGTH=73 /DNA_ID=CAMNT_0011544811 /DNA_START=165 /DNA_END=383 /DNA_ORIENTATION=-
MSTINDVPQDARSRWLRRAARTPSPRPPSAPPTGWFFGAKGGPHSLTKPAIRKSDVTAVSHTAGLTSHPLICG